MVEAVRHMRLIMNEIRKLINMPDDELMTFSKNIAAPYELVREVKRLGRLPVVNFAAGGIATPADAALMMQLGCDGIFVGSGIFKSNDPKARAKAIVDATLHYDDSKLLSEISKGLDEAMPGLDITLLHKTERMQERGW